MNSKPQAILVSSKRTDDVILSSIGEYRLDGESRGYPRFRRVLSGSGKATTEARFLYRTESGQWSVATSEAGVSGSKGAIVSTEVSESPIGLLYRINTGQGKWPKDYSLKVEEVLGKN